MISEDNINVLLQQIGKAKSHSNASVLGIRAVLELKKQNFDTLNDKHFEDAAHNAAKYTQSFDKDSQQALLDELVGELNTTNNLKEKKAYYRLIQAYLNEHYPEDSADMRECYFLLANIPSRYLPMFIQGLDENLRGSAELFLRAYAILEHYQKYYPNHEQTQTLVQQFRNYEFKQMLDIKPLLPRQTPAPAPAPEPMPELLELEALLKNVEEQYADEPEV